MEATGSKEINYFPNGVEVHRDNNLKRYYVVYDGVRIGEPQSSDMSDEEWEEILKGAAKL
jgi:hypothetical protein